MTTKKTFLMLLVVLVIAAAAYLLGKMNSSSRIMQTGSGEVGSTAPEKAASNRLSDPQECVATWMRALEIGDSATTDSMLTSELISAATSGAAGANLSIYKGDCRSVSWSVSGNRAAGKTQFVTVTFTRGPLNRINSEGAQLDDAQLASAETYTPKQWTWTFTLYPRDDSWVIADLERQR